ncbi:MAG: Ig-like domain-containing protein, partial [Candidatus Gracilibacteria bacterium]|nr:Ig-like domain-containing protein [Candidatus Gracilibacteria bacterium]
TVYDQSKANPWPVGDDNLPSSMERKAIPGNGLTASNWYSAQSGVGFDAAGPLGTPRTVNVFDSTPPTITSSSPANNTLFPMGVITLSYTYTDAGGIAPTPNYTFLLEKNNRAGVYADVTAASISSSGITASTASFTTNALAFGAYRATFTITDAAGNTTQDIVAPFFVDNFQMTISTGAINIGALSVGALVSATDTVTVTVKTVGAGFDLSLGGDSTMQAGVSQIQAWNAGQDKGFGFDWTETGIGTKAYNGFLTAIAPTQIATYALAPEANGNQKTYTYTVKYGAKIDALQAAGVYQALPDFRVNIQY